MSNISSPFTKKIKIWNPLRRSGKEYLYVFGIFCSDTKAGSARTIALDKFGELYDFRKSSYLCENIYLDRTLTEVLCHPRADLKDRIKTCEMIIDRIKHTPRYSEYLKRSKS